MSDLQADRFTVRALLAPGAITAPPVDPGALDELLGWFRSECAAIVAHCPPDAVPLRLPKARISDLLSCELGALARLGGSALGEAVVKGRLTDQLVAQHVTVGLTPAVEDDLRDGLAAAGDDAVQQWLEDADEATRAELWAHAEAVAAALPASWGELPRDWWPRPQERVLVEVADGVLLLAAQFDVALGGPPTDHPLVVLEVKSGSAADRNRRDLLWYGLLAVLRHGVVPAVIATWSASDDGLVPIPVTLGALEAAARRGLAALERLVELAGGRPPSATPHAGCRWCPELERCPAGRAAVERGGPKPTVGSGPADEPDDLAGDDEWDPGRADEEPW